MSEDTNDGSDDRTHRWEIPIGEWDALRDVLADRLVRSARIATRIAYSNLASGLPFDGPNSHALAEMLTEISEASLAQDQLMLSALAVYISGDEKDEPGPGFYRCAQHLGRLRPDASEDERKIFWGEEVERCYEQYRALRPRQRDA